MIEVSLRKAKHDPKENLRLQPGDVVSVEQTPATMFVEAIRILPFHMGHHTDVLVILPGVIRLMPPKPSTPTGLASPDVNLMQEVLRFLRVLQRRKRLMILSLLITGALGALYFATTPRIYQSRASLLVQQNQPDTWSKRAGDMMVKDLMDTYRNMLSSDVVLGEALKILPPESQVDLKDAPANKWPEILRRNLNVSVVRKTNNLEVTYRSKSPQAAAMVVDCIVTAYLKFMDKLHKSTASEMLEILTREKGRLEADLNVRRKNCWRGIRWATSFFAKGTVTSA